MGVDEAVWALVRRAHDNNAETIAAFCRRIGVSRSAYYRRRKAENWPPRQATSGNGDTRSTTRKKPTGTSPAKSSSTNVRADRPKGGHRSGGPGTQKSDGAKRKNASRKRLIKRLYAAIDHELERLENGPFAEVGASVPDIERTTRTLMNMIRGLEKVLELETDKSNRSKQTRSQARAATGRRASDKTDAARDAERMRQDIADRLGRIHAQWSSDGGSQPS